MYISIEQALDVYDELMEAFNGTNGFGGTVAEIYVFRVMPSSPTYSMHNEGRVWDEDNRMMEKKVAEDFHTLCHIFTKKHQVEIKIDEVELHEWISKIRTGELRFFHRVHVEVIKQPKSEKNV